MSNPTEISPHDRLIASRKAIVRSMRDGDPAPSDLRYSERPDSGIDRPQQADPGKWQLVKYAVHTWWQRHPAHLALALAKPALGHYADEKPLRLIGVAAGVGAAVVLIRPWRLVSITSLMIAAVKSSEMSALALALLSRPPKKTQKEIHD